MINPSKIFTQGITLTLTGLVACTSPQQLAGETTTSAPDTNTEPKQTAAQPVSALPASCTLVENGFGPQGQVQVRVEEVVTGLEVPWGVAFLPNNEMLVTERPGRVRLVQNGKLRTQSVATIDVSDRGEGGLLGIAVHPEFTVTDSSIFISLRIARGLPKIASNAGDCQPMGPRRLAIAPLLTIFPLLSSITEDGFGLAPMACSILAPETPERLTFPRMSKVWLARFCGSHRRDRCLLIIPLQVIQFTFQGSATPKGLIGSIHPPSG